MRHILTKFALAVLIFVGVVWYGLKKQQEGLDHLPDLAAELSQPAK